MSQTTTILQRLPSSAEHRYCLCHPPSAAHTPIHAPGFVRRTGQLGERKSRSEDTRDRGETDEFATPRPPLKRPANPKSPCGSLPRSLGKVRTSQARSLPLLLARLLVDRRRLSESQPMKYINMRTSDLSRSLPLGTGMDEGISCCRCRYDKASFSHGKSHRRESK
jgi:hypothetical protein